MVSTRSLPFDAPPHRPVGHVGVALLHRVGEHDGHRIREPRQLAAHRLLRADDRLGVGRRRGVANRLAVLRREVHDLLDEPVVRLDPVLEGRVRVGLREDAEPVANAEVGVRVARLVEVEVAVPGALAAARVERRRSRRSPSRASPSPPGDRGEELVPQEAGDAGRRVRAPPGFVGEVVAVVAAVGGVEVESRRAGRTA